MTKKVLNQSICLKEHLSEKEYKEVSKLEEICSIQDKINLKLELDYKLNMKRICEIGMKRFNEFFYYVEDVLVAYLGVSSFGGSNTGEINGLTHPDFRRKGIFKKLLELAIEECTERNYNKLLLLSDDKSDSGVGFIKAAGAQYDFSEYRMKANSKVTQENISPVNLRKAGKLDGKEIGRQNAIYFYGGEEGESFPEEEEELNESTYMVELKGETIGKIRVKYRDNSAFISGFGILPAFRSNGYGKAAIKGALHIINEKGIYDVGLDVESKNSNALNLYKACGFEEKSVMNYYNYTIKR